jgi:hypothetical protein
VDIQSNEPTEEKQPARSVVWKIFKAIGMLVGAIGVLFVLGLVWMFVTSGLHGRGYERDRHQFAVGVPAETVLENMTHADRVTISWKAIDADPQAALRRYRFRAGFIERPVSRTGKPAGIESCELEYRIFAFARRFVTMQFDENDKVSSIRDWTLD